jgi:hypothetical protein
MTEVGLTTGEVRTGAKGTGALLSIRGAQKPAGVERPRTPCSKTTKAWLFSNNIRRLIRYPAEEWQWPIALRQVFAFANRQNGLLSSEQRLPRANPAPVIRTSQFLPIQISAEDKRGEESSVVMNRSNVESLSSPQVTKAVS